ncbi:MAG: hypothetical protein FJ040_09435 [Chloroflexi bacterium]|nr:hypothetical protein [Chloroflexota bacterium]
MNYGIRMRSWLIGIISVFVIVLAYAVPQYTAAQTPKNTLGHTAKSNSLNMPMASTGFTSISAGMIHTCALTSAGVAYCWGFNSDGQLGDGTTTNRSRPVAVRMPVGVTFASISVGGGHTCARTRAGVAYCWGTNWAGQLGMGGTQVPRPCWSVCRQVSHRLPR